MVDPSHSPQTEDDGPRGTRAGAAKPRPPWGLILAIAVIIALIGLMVFLHLTGTLGPGVH
jgi:hypothetical protein